MHVQPISFPDSVRWRSVSQSGTRHKKGIGLPIHACGAFKVKSRACVTRVVQGSCQARGTRHESKKKSTFRPLPRTVSCCNSLTVMYMDLVLGVYSKALLQDSCSLQWLLGKFPHSQLCCRHLKPNPYNDSHCVAAPVRYDTRLSPSSTCAKDKGPHKADSFSFLSLICGHLLLCLCLIIGR